VNERATVAVQLAGLVAVFVGVSMFSLAAALIVVGVTLVVAGESRL
jgi:hypothetical protein